MISPVFDILLPSRLNATGVCEGRDGEVNQGCPCDLQSEEFHRNSDPSMPAHFPAASGREEPSP